MALSVGSGARVFVDKSDSFCALQACTDGFRQPLEQPCPSDIFASPTGNFNIITRDHLLKNKNDRWMCSFRESLALCLCVVRGVQENWMFLGGPGVMSEFDIFVSTSTSAFWTT